MLKPRIRMWVGATCLAVNTLVFVLGLCTRHWGTAAAASAWALASVAVARRARRAGRWQR